MVAKVEEKTHARKSPSGAHRWRPCPGSVPSEGPFEDEGSHYARWGTVCHEVADLILQDVIDDKGKWAPRDAESYAGRVFEVEGHELEFDMEMADCVNDYIAHVESFWAPDAILLPEISAPIGHITGEEGATGTSDCVIIHPKQNEVCVIDLKGGKGVMVDAEDNDQALLYAGGVLEEYELLYGPFDKIRAVIIQPRLNHVSEWLITREQLDEELERIKADAAAVPTDEEWAKMGEEEKLAFLYPGEKQCRFCKAAKNKACPALDNFVVDQLAKTAPPARADEFPDLTLPKKAAAAVPDESVDHEALAEAWRALPLIEKWIEGVRNAVHSRLHDGKPVGSGDHELTLYEGKRGARYWTDKDAAEERMRKSRVKADDMFTKTLISPTQAEKKLKDNKSLWADLAGYIDQNDGNPVVGLVGDEKRTPWSVCPPDAFPDLDAEEDDLFA